VLVMGITVSIIICTRNRADSLRETLDSVALCEVPPDMVPELVVVDNGSTDHTAQVLAEVCVLNMPLRSVVEARAGLSNARNRGLAETNGEIILFTDDDVRVPTDWLEGMCRPIAAGEADAVAGGIVFPSHVDSILRLKEFRDFRGWFASTEAMSPDAPGRLVGANMAFSRRVLSVVPGFDPDLGAGASGYGEETDFSRRLLSANLRLTARFDTAVEHHLDVSRISTDRLLTMASAYARSEASFAATERLLPLSKALRHSYRGVLRTLGLWIRRAVLRLPEDPVRRVKSTYYFRFYSGYVLRRLFVRSGLTWRRL
jgi:glucosyl-dolichyl phosphate glucuronosyltransferase